MTVCDATVSMALRVTSGFEARYTCVVFTDECPRKSLILYIFTPLFTKWVALLWRKRCGCARPSKSLGLSFFTISAYFWSIYRMPCFVSGFPCLFANSWSCAVNEKTFIYFLMIFPVSGIIGISRYLFPFPWTNMRWPFSSWMSCTFKSISSWTRQPES